MKQIISSLPQKKGLVKTYGNAEGAATALLIAEALQQHNGPALIIAEDTLMADRLAREIPFFQDENDQGQPKLQHFPDWETLPYDRFSASEEIRSQRIKTLYDLKYQTQTHCITSINAVLHYIAPVDALLKSTLMMKAGDAMSLENFRLALTQAGYRHVEQVFEHGEYASRGSLLDIFPMGADTPFRIDFFDDEVDSIRTFDSETQRSIDKVSHIQLLPAYEHSVDDEAKRLFRNQWRERFSGDLNRHLPYQDLSQGYVPAGIEYYLPLFFKESETLFHYLPDNTLIITSGNLQKAIGQYWQELSSRFDQYGHDIEYPLLKPNEICLDDNTFFSQLKNFPRLHVQNESIQESAGRYNVVTNALPNIEANASLQYPFTNFKSFIQESTLNLNPNQNNDTYRILLCVDSAGRQEILLEQLKQHQLKPSLVISWQDFYDNKNNNDTKNNFAITVHPLTESVSLAELGISIITESALFGQHTTPQSQKARRVIDPDTIIKNLTELNIGDAVVHIEHGIGRYLGLQTIEADGQPAEYLTLEYAGESKLYVPVTSLHLINRYTGAAESAPALNRLGTEQWSKARRKAIEKARDTAAELLELYAKREAQSGFSFPAPDDEYQQFANEFAFEETEDQQKAIISVNADMQNKRPMDRLVCGDVGFGKTEVAMRAAFQAANSGKQVAILVPTTLLAQQHHQSFSDRFANWPIKVGILSRFQSSKAQGIIKQIEGGQLDIIIGTHKLLSEGIKFNNLGLLIIDEEHRFGVRQKERLKQIRNNVDILALTATPIPRTLNMSMAGIRDMSIIATPPAKRLAIKTFIRERQDSLIREAILREILRGGQVYVLHNKVESIERIATEIAELVPEANVNTAHGQMRERELEKTMSDFYHHRFNVLVCTTIIETGIDIPSANTIIIDRADHLGLAQLHQLRGRVGRSHHQAYAYLLTPHPKSMTSDAKKRLEALAAADTLGAGFILATHDLEIRGAGEILGEGQSGHIQSVGYSLYMDILDRAVKAMKQGKTLSLDDKLNEQTEINLHVPALIPDDYMPDVHMRLTLYKRIASAENNNALDNLQVEMIDRFGLLPKQCNTLFAVTRLKLQAQALGIRKIEANAAQGSIIFDKEPNINTAELISLIQKQAHIYRLEGAERLKFKVNMTEYKKRLSTVEDLLKKLVA
ncbi:transcription-repair coupling factor [Piscirickettsia litoralis]|uniref:Transcription-repair-coupling factor n=1 Tax=Piscirickettsia litoralis TaxID=1891921 RepID=A0ABX3ACP3_9GAMM|nr:transcription-repair coupling factor [Piscirickettsia litoralis]ODN43949.1 transcription-repair coupling factor [Piscirickettsia litoralis]